MPVSAEIWTKFASDDYQRNNKRTGVKNLRCFPLCSPERHVKSGFCGQSLVVTLNDVPAKMLPGADDSLVVWARLELVETQPGFQVNDAVAEVPLLAQSRTRQTPTAPWMLGEIRVSGSDVTARINGDRLGWNYSWVSNKHTCDAMHCVRVYVFKRSHKVSLPTPAPAQPAAASKGAPSDAHPSSTDAEVDTATAAAALAATTLTKSKAATAAAAAAATATAAALSTDPEYKNLKLLCVVNSPSFKIYCRRRNKSSLDNKLLQEKLQQKLKEQQRKASKASKGSKANKAGKGAKPKGKGTKRKADVDASLTTLAIAAASTKRIPTAEVIIQRGWHHVDASAPLDELLKVRAAAANGRLTPVSSGVLLDILLQYCDESSSDKLRPGEPPFEATLTSPTSLPAHRMLLRGVIGALFGCDVRMSMDGSKATGDTGVELDKLASLLATDATLWDRIGAVVGAIERTSTAASMASKLLSEASKTVSVNELAACVESLPASKHTSGLLFDAIQASVRKQSVLLSQTLSDKALVASGHYVCVEPIVATDLFFKPLESVESDVPEVLLALPYAMLRSFTLHATPTKLLLDFSLADKTATTLECALDGASHESSNGDQLKELLNAVRPTLREKGVGVGGDEDVDVMQSGWIVEATGAVVVVHCVKLEKGQAGVPTVVLVKQTWAHDDKSVGQNGDAVVLQTEVTTTQGGVSTSRNLVQRFVRTCDLRMMARVTGMPEIVWTNPEDTGSGGGAAGAASGSAGTAGATAVDVELV
jgi:hypothetical protein